MPKVSLRDLARDIANGKYKEVYLYPSRGAGKSYSAEYFKELLDGFLGRLSNQQWYLTHGFKHDVGFEKANSKPYTARCVICGRHGNGRTGTYWDAEEGRSFSRWQYDCVKPHTFECSCGLFFPKSQALGAHVAANRRHRNEGHGRMDKVGY